MFEGANIREVNTQKKYLKAKVLFIYSFIIIL